MSPVEIEFSDLHQRLLTGDPIATSELAEALFQPLVNSLGRKHSNLKDRQLVDDAVSEALMAYLKNPRSYEPSKKSLKNYLFMAAEKDLLNLLAKAKRRLRKEIAFDPVELPERAGNSPMEAEPANASQKADLLSKLESLFPEPQDRAAVELMLKGERSTKAFAEVFKITYLGKEEQKVEVKKHKDRLNMKLTRFRKRTYLEEA